MVDVLLRTKLFIPPTRPEYVPRPRLIARLDDGLRRKLTLLSAPAGFGKSTLLAGWILQKEIPCGWFSLEESENDLVRFLTYLVAAVNSVEPNVGSGVADFFQVSQLQSPEPVLNILINELSALDRHFVLVLDDYHLINSKRVHKALEYLIEHLPACMHIYIATRADPQLPLSLLRGRGEMIELRAEDLRFSGKESVEFIQRSTGKSLSDIDATTLTQLTEGWITGMQMAALSIKDRMDVTAFLRDFSGSNRYVLDYLVEEVLIRQSEKIQQFLYRTSILNRMTGPLCDSLLVSSSDESDSSTFIGGEAEHILSDLERVNLFIVPLDDERRWYRYHHLFADLLRKRVSTQDQNIVNRLHKKAATWYRAQEMIPEAVHHELACADYDSAVNLIAGVAEDAMMHSDFTMLKGWIDRLPDQILIVNPRLNIYHLLTSLFSGMPVQEAVSQLDRIIAQDQENEIQGDILAVQALLAAYQQEINHSAELAEQAIKILPESRTFFRSTITGFLGFAYLLHGNTRIARPILEDAARISHQTGNLTMNVLALCHLAEIATIEARMGDAETYYHQALRLGLDSDGKPRPILGMAIIGLGMVQVERGQLDEAFDNLSRGVLLVEKWALSGALQGYINMARIHQLRGDEGSADAAIESAAQLARQFEPLEEDDRYVLCHRAKLQIIRGDALEALRILSINPEITSEDLDGLFPPLDPQSLRSPTGLFNYILAAEAFFALEKFQISERLFSLALEATREKAWTRIDMMIMVYQSELYAHYGKYQQALEILEQALKIAARGGIVVNFLERGKRITPLLQNALHAGIEPGFVSKLLTRISDQTSWIYPISPSEKANLVLIEPLSPRELEVLHLVAEGCSNSVIASQMVLAVNTVKKHVSNILGKLGVTNREEAAKRGRELGLL